MALPEGLVDPVVEAKRLADHQTSILEQLALAELIGSGQYDRHIRRCRQVYRRRRDTLLAALRERAPGVRLAGIAAGQHVLVELPTDGGAPGRDSGPDEARVVNHARSRGLALESLSTYVHPAAAPRRPALVVGYATPSDQAFAGAVELLCRVLGSYPD
ncbi:MAG: hypothetical protein ACRDO2_13350 [Nocardioidaceae bacterium]